MEGNTLRGEAEFTQPGALFLQRQDVLPLLLGEGWVRRNPDVFTLSFFVAMRLNHG